MFAFLLLFNKNCKRPKIHTQAHALKYNSNHLNSNMYIIISAISTVVMAEPENTPLNTIYLRERSSSMTLPLHRPAVNNESYDDGRGIEAVALL